MLKTNIIDEAKELESQADSFVSQTKQLLLEENAHENNLLFSAGMNGAHIERVRLKNENAMRKELRMKTGAQAVLTLEEIKTLCIRYRLRFLPSRKYSGAIDSLTGRKLAEFLNKNGDPSPEMSASQRLFIMAPADAFDLEITKVQPPDPVLFYRHDDGLYSVIHKWGNDFTVFRRIVGALTSSALAWRWFLFLSIVLVGHVLGYAIYLMGSQDGAVITTCLGYCLALVRLFSLVENYDGKIVFSDKAWNEERRSDRPLIFM